MKNRLIKTAITCTVLGTSLFGAAPVFANEYDSQIEEAQRQAQENEQAANGLDAIVNQLSNEVASTQDALNNLKDNISRNEVALETALEGLELTHDEMNRLLEEIAILETNIENRSVKLEEQARIVQVNGNPSNYFEFILNSDSLTDVIARIDVVTSLVSSSNNMIEDQKKDQQAVEEKSAETERKIVQQNALAEELESTAANLEIQKTSQVALVAQLELEKNNVSSDREALIAQRDSALLQVNNLESEREAVKVAVQQAKVEREEQGETGEEEASVVETPQASTVSVASSSQESNENSSSTQETTNPSSNSGINEATNNQSTPAPESAPASVEESVTESAPVAQPKPKPKAESKPTPAPVKPKPAPAPATPAPSSNVIAIANQYLGTTYKWAGTTPGGGFDCSGFTSYVFAQAGKQLPRTAAAQYASSTKVSNPQPGDLVFFSGNGNGITHVGIYTGNGQYVGSQSSTGVAYTSATTGYWGARLVGYGRY